MNESKFNIFHFRALIARRPSSISSAGYVERMNIKAQLYIVRFRRIAKHSRSVCRILQTVLGTELRDAAKTADTDRGGCVKGGEEE